MAGSNRTSPALPQMPMSLEAALDEERRDVMAALEGEKKKSSPKSTRDRTATPPPPAVRSMLDVDAPVELHYANAGLALDGVSPTTVRRAILNPADPATWTSRHKSFSSGENESARNRQRSMSEAKNQPAGLPKIQDESKDINKDYDFTVSPTLTAQQAPKRVTQGGSRPREGSGTAMAAALSGDFSSLYVGNAKGVASGRHNSTVGIGAKSRSPSSRIIDSRSDSPGSRMLSSAALLSPTSPKTITTDSGKVVNMNKAYRKLADRTGDSGSFSTVGDNESEAGARVPEDIGDEHMHEDAVESDEDEGSSEDERGRKRGRRKKSSGSEADGDDGEVGDESMTGSGMLSDSGSTLTPTSQMAAAEDERKAVSATEPVKSLLEPSISVTSPTGEKLTQKRTGVHPASNFDQAGSGMTSAASSDSDEGVADISKARKLGLNVSAIDQHVPDRVVRIVLRGDWQAMQREADEGRRRQRLYLVATDISDEAVYALEWTIGTILRDGDTLLAIYAIESENAVDPAKASEADRLALQAEGARAGQEANATMENLTNTTQRTMNTNVDMLSPTSYVPATETDSITGSVDKRNVTPSQMERLRAVEEISQTCVRLLRKTRLQVRVTVEVISCKSPKHLITGAIDELEPTLVVLGSRGRSALKGVLLGSFSNYLVTKSSVPVMVARKKLKKHAKVTGNRVRLTNNLQVGGVPAGRRSLAEAKTEINRARKKSI